MNKNFFKKPIFVFTFYTVIVCLVGYLNVKIYQQRHMQLAVQSSSGEISRAIASEGGYSFGGACGSQGSWTAQAKSQTALIRNVLINLRNDPACKGIESIVDNLASAKGESELDEYASWESLPYDIKSLSGFVGKGTEKNKKDIMQVLMGKTIDNSILAGNLQSLAIRSKRTIKVGLDLVDQSFNALPGMDACLSKHPDQLLALFGASLKLTSAFVTSGDTMLTRVGSTVAKMVTFLQNKKYSKILNGLLKSEYWASLSCIVETTTDTYCAAEDAYDMLSYSSNESQLSEKADQNFKDQKDNPLEGYYLLVRDLPVVTEWLQKVQAGAEPQKNADALNYAEVSDNYNNFKKLQNELLVKYSTSMEIIKTTTDETEKRIKVYNMVQDLSTMITRFGGGENFILSGKTSDVIPFYLIGIPRVPKEVIGAVGEQPMDPFKYMKNFNNGGFIHEFDVPKDLAVSVGENLKSLLAVASQSASTYFQTKMVVDTENLVDESLTSQVVTVYQSLKNMSNYLEKFITRSKQTRTNKIQIPNMIKTKKQIDEVLAAYDSIQNQVDGYLDILNTNEKLSDKERKELNEEIDNKIADDPAIKIAYKNIIDKAFKNFNILLQNETYLMTRMSTFVRKDYMQRVNDKTDLSDYQQELMTIAGKNIIDRIGDVTKQNSSLVQLDLQHAQTINLSNLAAVEKLFADQFVGMIASVKNIADGKADRPASLNFNSLKRMLDATFAKNKLPVSNFTPLYELMTMDYWFHRERYPFELFPGVKPEEDFHKSFDGFRSRLCIQALAFKNQAPFYSLCDGAKLKAVGIDNEEDRVRLSTDYTTESSNGMNESNRNELGGREQILKHSSTDVSRIWRGRNICAYKNFRSKNYAYWLVKTFGKEAKSIKAGIANP